MNIQALNDVSFQFFLAKLFGVPTMGSDGNTTLIGYLWRGILYVPEPHDTSKKFS